MLLRKKLLLGTLFIFLIFQDESFGSACWKACFFVLKFGLT